MRQVSARRIFGGRISRTIGFSSYLLPSLAGLFCFVTMTLVAVHRFGIAGLLIAWVVGVPASLLVARMAAILSFRASRELVILIDSSSTERRSGRLARHSGRDRVYHGRFGNEGR